MNAENDTNVTVNRIDDTVYSLDPYPFRDEGLEVSYQGRFLAPASAGDNPDMEAVMRDTPREQQGATLVAA